MPLMLKFCMDTSKCFEAALSGCFFETDPCDQEQQLKSTCFLLQQAHFICSEIQKWENLNSLQLSSTWMLGFRKSY